MKKLLLLLLLIITSNTAFCQRSKSYDIIKFKDGSEYRGNLLEYVKGEYLIIDVGQYSVKVEGTQFQQIAEIGFDKLNYYDNLKGFWYELQVAVTTGRNNNFSSREAYPMISALSGYQFHKLLGVGLGSGYQAYSNVNIVPFYATVRGDLFRTRVTPFYYMDAGYGVGVNKDDEFFFGQEEDAKGGFLYAAGVGSRFKFRKTYLTTSLGWRMQKSRVRRTVSSTIFNSIFPRGDEVFTEKRTYRRAEIKIGIGF